MPHGGADRITALARRQMRKRRIRQLDGHKAYATEATTDKAALRKLAQEAYEQFGGLNQQISTKT